MSAFPETSFTLLEKIGRLAPGQDEAAWQRLWVSFGTSDGFSFNFADDKVSIILPDIVKFSQEWPMIRFKIVSDMRDSFGVDTVELTEVWSKAPAKDDKKKEEKEE